MITNINFLEGRKVVIRDTWTIIVKEDKIFLKNGDRTLDRHFYLDDVNQRLQSGSWKLLDPISPEYSIY